MKHILEPLAHIPGVRVAALVTIDGVPITMHGTMHRQAKNARSTRDADARENEKPSEGTRGQPPDVADDMNALSALATAWIGEINRAVAPLSWDAPRRLVLRAARGTLILQQAPGALLLVVLDGGTSAEDLRLPMEGAVARMQRHLRAIGSRGETAAELEHQPSILPSRSGAWDSNKVSTTGNEVPEVSGE